LALFQNKTRVLLVCTENICRSPMAEGLLRHCLQQSELRDRVEVSSAGTQASQAGLPPDQRATRVAALYGIDLSRIRARRVTVRDLERSDFVFAMDEANMRDLRQLCPREHMEKLRFLLTPSAEQPLLEVPDPYYGNAQGFERVFQIIDEAMDGIVDHIRSSI
jgi:protein-tyrosine phosphatase